MVAKVTQARRRSRFGSSARLTVSNIVQPEVMAFTCPPAARRCRQKTSRRPPLPHLEHQHTHTHTHTHTVCSIFLYLLTYVQYKHTHTIASICRRRDKHSTSVYSQRCTCHTHTHTHTHTPEEYVLNIKTFYFLHRNSTASTHLLF